MKRLFPALLLQVCFVCSLCAQENRTFKAGIIGLDTSHVIAFTKILNDPEAPPELAGCRVVAAYPPGSPDIESSTSRVPKYTAQLSEMGVEIVGSIEELLEKVDVILLESNDGRPHLEQVRPVLRAGKPVFIDKPISASLSDAMKILREAEEAGVPVFSSSSLRFGSDTQDAVAGKYGKIEYCETHSPASIEKTHPDLFWYGIHGVEALFTVLGTGCESVVRSQSEEGKIVVTGQWSGGRTGVFREGKGFGGMARGDKGEGPVGDYDTYRPLLVEIVKFFRTGVPPVKPEETLEILAFMEAADESKRQGGKAVSIAEIMERARKEASLAGVKIYDLRDRIRFEIDGELFTEWRHDEWVAPYLYPVIGPTGNKITRSYPMESGVEGESQDHPHHRSLRFAHSDVNGSNFWYWRPGRERELSDALIVLEKIESITPGSTGELVVWNRWMKGDELVLREKMRLAVTPLPDGETLLDYDVELHAADQPVTFGDMKDGGLLVRVAGTMKSHSNEKQGGSKLKGSIVNSRGDVDAGAWGKRAEWVDYSGPDADGETVGIAMFDHPDNLRFPTHWHARTYGLLTANRFGRDHFDPKFAKAKGVSCRPHGTECPACQSRGGDYTIPAGESLTLKHRLYLHHGEAGPAGVVERYQEYIREGRKERAAGYPGVIKKIVYPSKADDSEQPALFWTPESDEAVPLLVALHTWSGGYEQGGSQVPLAEWCLQENWAFIHPHFRGPNWTPEALGSELAVQDIISAVEHARTVAKIDENRIYCVGVSGGGHASMLMAARAPDIWAGVSAWCGISDVEKWYHQCKDTRFERYAGHIEKALGHVPEESADALRRSPGYWLEKNRDRLPVLDLWHGIDDGRSGSVPFTQSLRAWNAAVTREATLPESFIDETYRTQNFPASEIVDVTLEGREVRYRKEHGKTRINLFEGGHEILQETALNWLAAQRKGDAPVWDIEDVKRLKRVGNTGSNL